MNNKKVTTPNGLEAFYSHIGPKINTNEKKENSSTVVYASAGIHLSFSAWIIDIMLIAIIHISTILSFAYIAKMDQQIFFQFLKLILSSLPKYHNF